MVLCSNIQFPVPSSVAPKSKSPSRRAKSRWEPIQEEKVVDKSANISYGTMKFGTWNDKQVLMNNLSLLLKLSVRKNWRGLWGGRWIT